MERCTSPLVSIIVPTHNRPEFLEKTLVSILNQSYKMIEVLVISNGINDRNKAVVENLNNPKLRYFHQENSGGPASPRNYGIREAKGKYLAFCDDDDLWMPEKLYKQVKALEEHAEYGLCYTKMIRFDEKNEWSVPHEGKRSTFESILYVNTIPISSVVILKSLVDLYGGFSESKMVGTSEDYEFLLRHAIKSKYYFLDDFLIKYWSGKNRTTAIDSGRRIKDCISYLKGVLGCYLLNKNIGFSRIIKPAFFQIKECLKSIAYIILTKYKLIKISRECHD